MKNSNRSTKNDVRVPYHDFDNNKKDRGEQFRGGFTRPRTRLNSFFGAPPVPGLFSSLSQSNKNKIVRRCSARLPTRCVIDSLVPYLDPSYHGTYGSHRVWCKFMVRRSAQTYSSRSCLEKETQLARRVRFSSLSNTTRLLQLLVCAAANSLYHKLVGVVGGSD